jgi:DNA-binding winged helix-turn-helix (wHTH) protein
MGSAQAPPALVRFDGFEADLRAGELRRNGVRVRLQDLPFRALTLLLSRPGEVITREEFRQALWPSDVFVDFAQGISSAVMRLRDALRDSADNPVFIETIERRGYRWIGPIQRQEPLPEGPREKESKEDQATLSAAVQPLAVADDGLRPPGAGIAFRGLDFPSRPARCRSKREIQSGRRPNPSSQPPIARPRTFTSKAVFAGTSALPRA